MYLNGEEGEDCLVPMKSGDEDLEVVKTWNFLNADLTKSSVYRYVEQLNILETSVDLSHVALRSSCKKRFVAGI